MKRIVALTALILIGCGTPVALKKSPITWKTESGYPEAVLTGAAPREITGLIQSYLGSDYELVSGDDYKAKFRGKKPTETAITYLPEFTYISVPGGKVRVIAEPKIEALGEEVKADPESSITHDSDAILGAIENGQAKH